MKYTVQIDIDQPRDTVVECFRNPDYLPKWQPDLLELEPLEGIPGQPGGKTRLVYRSGSREIEMVETVTDRALPERLEATYTTEGVYNHVVNRFEQNGDHTRWRMESEFRGTGVYRWMIWLAPWLFRRESKKTMRRFKTFCETGTPPEA